MLNKEERFKQILQENNERIQRICSYYGLNEEDKKDIYQEVLVNIWNSLERYRGDAAMSTWIYRIAVNTALSFSGKTIKQQKFQIPLETKHLGKLLDEDGIEQKLDITVQLEHLRTELNCLSVIDKTIISLVLEELSMREIADIIGITEPNVKVKVHRIKKELRKNLEDTIHQ